MKIGDRINKFDWGELSKVIVSNNDIPEDILKSVKEIEISKKALNEFFKSTKMIPVLIINDKCYDTVHYLDKNGTFPDFKCDIPFEGTGVYYKKYDKRQNSKNVFYIQLAGVKNIFDVINFFENNIEINEEMFI